MAYASRAYANCRRSVKANKDSEAGKMPGPELIAEMGKFNQALIDAGIMLDGGGAQAEQPGRARRLLRGRPQGATGSVRKHR